MTEVVALYLPKLFVVLKLRRSIESKKKKYIN